MWKMPQQCHLCGTDFQKNWTTNVWEGMSFLGNLTLYVQKVE